MESDEDVVGFDEVNVEVSSEASIEEQQSK